MTSNTENRQSSHSGSASGSQPDVKATMTPAEQHDHVAQNATAPRTDLPPVRPAEKGGQAGPEPTRYGDWEKKGRCTDF